MKPRLTGRYAADLVQSCEADLGPKNFAMLMAASGTDGSYVAISAALGMPGGTVRSRLHRARTRMEKIMAARAVYAAGTHADAKGAL